MRIKACGAGGGGGAREGEGNRADKRGGCGSTDSVFSSQFGFLFQVSVCDPE